METCPDWLTVERCVDDVAMRARHSVLSLVDFGGRPSGLADLSRFAKLPDSQRGELR